MFSLSYWTTPATLKQTSKLYFSQQAPDPVYDIEINEIVSYFSPSYQTLEMYQLIFEFVVLIGQNITMFQNRIFLVTKDHMSVIFVGCMR